jgi:hypothetical protein
LIPTLFISDFKGKVDNSYYNKFISVDKRKRNKAFKNIANTPPD